MTSGLVVALAAVYLLVLAGKAMGVWVVVRATAREAHRAGSEALSDVTVLTPIFSGDPDLPAVLAHQATALAGAHLVWLVDTDDAQGQTIVESVRASHPEAAIAVVSCTPVPPGRNPKTAKLAQGLGHVRTPMVLVLDDDARLTADSLRQMMREAREADLVTALPHYRDASSFAGRLLGAFVNTNAALTYLSLLPWRAPVSINGMCYLLHTEDWRRRGGFAPLDRQLADDLAVAECLHATDGRLKQSTAGVSMHTTVASLPHYVAQMHRWSLFALLLLREQGVVLRGLIVGLLGVPPALLSVVLVGAVLVHTPAALGAACLVLVVRGATLAAVQQRVTGVRRHRPLLSVLSDVLLPLHLLHALCVRRIRWRSRCYRVRANDDFQPA